jgi:predicted nucleotidyltransferase
LKDLSEITVSRIRDFCERWRIVEFALFGSILRDDYRPDSDVDVLVTVPEDTSLTLYDWVDMEDELKEIFGRHVDLISKSGLRNPFRRHEILRTCRVIYASADS